MVLAILFILPIWKVELSWNILASPTCCVHMLLDWLLIILLLVNTNKGVFLMHQLHAHMVIETRKYILYDYKQYKKSWNSKQKSLKDVLIFLK